MPGLPLQRCQTAPPPSSVSPYTATIFLPRQTPPDAPPVGHRQKSTRHPLPNRGRRSYVGGVRPLSSIPRRLTAARAALLWERLWSGLWPAVTLAGLFGALALSDLLPRLPGWLHAAVLAVFGLAFVAALVVGLRPFRWPTLAEAGHRLERPVLHRPLTASRDSLAQGGSDPLSRVLWEAHARRAAAEAAGLRGVVPHPGVPARDPRGLRSLAVLALFVTVIAAWNDPWPRVARALSPSLSGGAAPVLTADVWVTPPEYTGQAPFYRTGVEAGTGDPLSIEAPEGSRLLLLIHGADTPVVRLGAVYETPQTLADDSHRLEADLVATTEATDTLAVMEGGRILAEWPLRVAPDAAPRIAFAEPPGEGARWRLRLPFEAADDHGLAALDVTIARDGAPRGSAETYELPLPPGQPATAAGQPLIDLTAHPWAGLPVTVHLTVRDALDQAGQTEALPITLPERVFTHPVAQELARQRKIVLHEPDQRFAVAAMLDAIASVPGRFDDDAVVFLTLRVASARLRHARSTAGAPQLDVAELLWQAALRVEDGALAAAEERMAEAERALEQALEDGADPQEIQRLVEELKQALAEFMQALMENMPEMALQDMPSITMPQDMIDPADMARMLDQLGEMSEIGAQEAARQMMEQLQEMLQALRNAQPMPSQQAQEMQEIMDALRDLAQQQEDLLNETFRNSREEAGEDSQQGRRAQQGNRPPQNQPGERGEASDPAAGAALAEAQEALRQALGEIMNRIGEQAGQVPENLGAAELDMRQASDALAGQSWAPAEEAQGRALDALRQGAGEAMQQMMQAMMQRGGQQGQGMMMPFGQQPGQSMDPMGRGFGGLQTEGTEIPTEPDTRRARDILMELRRRSNDIDRPTDERDYLRRLLRQF